jgi:hypothetical protein
MYRDSRRPQKRPMWFTAASGELAATALFPPELQDYLNYISAG